MVQKSHSRVLIDELDSIRSSVNKIEDKLVYKIPEHFGTRDVINAFFGAMIIGITFVLKGALINIGTHIPWPNVVLIVFITIFILSLMIYYVGYARVINKDERPFLQFWLKRLTAIYGISFLVSYFLLYLFAIYDFTSLEGFVKLLLILTLPCSLGASISELVKKY